MEAAKKFKNLSYDDKVFYGITVSSVVLWVFVIAVMSVLAIVAVYVSELNVKELFSFINFNNFFSSLNAVSKLNPYNTQGYNASLPPLAYIILYPFALIAGSSVPAGMTNTLRGIVSLCLFYVITLPVLCYLIFNLLKGKPKNKKFIFLIFSLISFPVLFLLLSPDFLIIALIFLLFFINFYKSENKTLKELSLVGLSLAAVTNIYPIFFIIILIREKRFFDCLKVLLYSLILFFLPFLIFEGRLSNFNSFINQAVNFASHTSSNSYDVSIYNSIKMIFGFFGIDNYQLCKNISLIISLSIAALSIISTFFLSKYWKVLLSLALICITIPTVSFAFSLVFLIPSIAYFFIEEKSKLDIIFAVLFLILFSALGFYMFINSFIIVIIQLALILSTIGAVILFIKKKLEKKIGETVEKTTE